MPAERPLPVELVLPLVPTTAARAEEMSAMTDHDELLAAAAR